MLALGNERLNTIWQPKLPAEQMIKSDAANAQVDSTCASFHCIALVRDAVVGHAQMPTRLALLLVHPYSDQGMWRRVCMAPVLAVTHNLD